MADTNRRLAVKLDSEQVDLLTHIIGHYRRTRLAGPGPDRVAAGQARDTRTRLRRIERELDIARLRFGRLAEAEVRSQSSRCRRTTGCVHQLGHDGRCAVYVED